MPTFHAVPVTLILLCITLLLTELKASKSYFRNRLARSVSFEVGGDLYAIQLEDGYQPVGPRNVSGGGPMTAMPRNDDDDFSGMGVTVAPKTGNSFMVPSSIKVTHR